MQNYTDVFISYGRRESKFFATKLYNKLLSNGYSAWFDQNDIPLGVDYQNQIDDGIEKAHTFIYIISPHSVNSPYCALEIELAVRRNKRIIPILHVDGFNFEKLNPAIGKINWIYTRESLDNEEASWENAKEVDSFEKSFLGLVNLLEQHKSYVQQHTQILHDALNWERHQKSTQHLLIGKQRQEAEKWLLTDFAPPAQPPCLPSDLHAEFICESNKNAANLMTETFISYDTTDSRFRDDIKKALEKHAITSWVHSKDIQSGVDFETAINLGIEQADNFLFFISKQSVESEWCIKELDYAISLNKRVIPLLIEEVKSHEIPAQIRQLQYINFTDNRDKSLARQENSDFQKDIDDLLREIRDEASYYMQHKVFLCQALKWQKNNKKGAFLLRGYNLQNAQTFLSAGKLRRNHKPTQIHEEFIEESIAKIGQLGSEVFVSYSRNDGDFARHLNSELQLIGKTTWFDQESIATGANFQKEIYRGIENSDNFLFLISPKALASPYCEDEVNYAAGLNKRFVSVLTEPLDAESMEKFKALPKLSEVQWIDFHEEDFTKSFYELLTTLDTDREHVQLHTKYSQRATDWQDRDRTTDLLLQGSQLKQAQAWLIEAESHKKHPEATVLVREFIEISNSAEIQKIALEKQRQAKEIKLEQEKAEAMQQALVAAENAAAEAIKAAEAAEKSLLLQKRASKIQKILGAIVGAIALFAIATAHTAYQEKQKAEKQKIRAEHNEGKANEEKTRAENLFKEANKRKREAEHSAAVAIEQTELAERSMLLAQRREFQIRLEEKKTKAALAQAETARFEMEGAYDIARSSLKEAEDAKIQAERQAELANISRQEMEQREIKLEQLLLNNVDIASKKKGHEYAQDLMKLAEFYELKAMYAKSDTLFDEAIHAMRNENKETDTYTKVLTNVADSYFKRTEYNKALPLYLEAEGLVKILHGDISENHARALNNVGLTYNRQGKFKEAVDYMLPAMEIRKSLFTEDSRTYGTSLNDVGLIYLAQERYDRAAEMFSKALDIERKNGAENTANYATMNSNMANALMYQEKYDEAEKLYLESFDIRKQLYAPTHIDYLRSIEDLGYLYKKKKDFATSAAYYQKCVDINKSAYGDTHPQYASAINYLAMVYDEQENYAKAIEMYKIAANSMEMGEHKTLDYAYYLTNIADSYEKVEELDSTQKYYELATPIKRKYLGEGSDDYLKHINDMGNIYGKQGNHETALKYYKQAADNEFLARGETAYYRTYLRNMAYAYKKLGDIDKQIEFLEKGAEVQKKLKGENSPEYALDLNEIANLYYNHATKTAKAGELYAKCALIESTSSVTKTENYFVYLRNLGLYEFNKAQNYDAARKVFENLLENTKTDEKIQNTTYASDMFYVAKTYYKAKDAKCVEYLEESAKIYKFYEGENKNYADVIQYLADYYFIQQKDYTKSEIYQIALCKFSKGVYQEAKNDLTSKEYAKDLRTLSYSQIMNGKMAEAEKTTNEGLKTEANNMAFEVRLAFIYCFTNRFDKGKAILLKYKSKEYPSELGKSRLFKDVYKDFYEDLVRSKQNKQVLEKLKTVIE